MYLGEEEGGGGVSKQTKKELLQLMKLGAESIELVLNTFPFSSIFLLFFLGGQTLY